LNRDFDAVVVGAGPNGLAAAITLAQARLSVLLVEANDEIGGGCRSAELTLPGFVHDVCSAIHPLAVASPFFKNLPLAQHGLDWIHPELPLAHPLDEQCAALHRPFAAQMEALGPDGAAYERLMGPFARNWEDLTDEVLKPLMHWPEKPLLMAKFGLKALRPAGRLARSSFKTESARALFAGLAAHSFLSLDATASAAVGLVLAMLGHGPGWPMPQGGAGQLARALGEHFKSLGGQIVTGQRVKTIDELPPARAVFLDLTARQVLAVAGHRFPAGYRRALGRFRYGPAVFKVDYALSSPIPWKHADCARAGTIHLGGTLAEIEKSEGMTARGELPERPFVLLAQATRFDPRRAPQGKHTAWAYCHIPQGCEIDMTNAVDAQIERFAPGFKDCVLARCARGPALLEKDNANLVGGDINGGLATLGQLVARPVLSFQPYRTPVKGVYICSASTPPGGGVHGMCGNNAAMLSLRKDFNARV
jgi:phytoene dehydrogenase-like protein